MSILISGAHPVPHRPAPYGIIIAAMGDVRVPRSATPTAVIFTLNQDSGGIVRVDSATSGASFIGSCLSA